MPETPKPTQQCSNCRYYHPTGAHTAQCRHSPPTRSPEEGDLFGFWPIVNGWDWCGKWLSNTCHLSQDDLPPPTKEK